MAVRVLAIIAAILLVGAFAIATMAPENMSLGQALYLLHRPLLRGLQADMRAHGMDWLWDQMLLPMLVRPAWLIPAGLGLICIGGAATVSSNKGAPRQHRRRS